MLRDPAGGEGGGAVCNGLETRGTWSLQKSSLHINCLELLAAIYAMKAFTKTLSNAHVLIQTNSTSAIAYKNKMGRGDKQGVLDQHRLTLPLRVVPGQEINPSRGGTHSRSSECRNRCRHLGKVRFSRWKLDSEVFKVLNKSYGPFTIDIFANGNNSQLGRFYSYLPDPLAEQFDTLVQPWREENVYTFPPFNLICVWGRQASKLQLCLLFAQCGQCSLGIPTFFGCWQTTQYCFQPTATYCWTHWGTDIQWS